MLKSLANTLIAIACAATAAWLLAHGLVIGHWIHAGGVGVPALPSIAQLQALDGAAWSALLILAAYGLLAALIVLALGHTVAAARRGLRLDYAPGTRLWSVVRLPWPRRILTACVSAILGWLASARPVAVAAPAPGSIPPCTPVTAARTAPAGARTGLAAGTARGTAAYPATDREPHAPATQPRSRGQAHRPRGLVVRRRVAALVYTVQRGDTLSAIAQRIYGSAAAYPRIFAASRELPHPGEPPLLDPNEIYPRMVLHAPLPAANVSVQGDRVIYIVQPGDSLSRIAGALTGNWRTYPDIAAANQGAITDVNLIYPGEKLVLPATYTALDDSGNPQVHRVVTVVARPVRARLRRRVGGAVRRRIAPRTASAHAATGPHTVLPLHARQRPHPGHGSAVPAPAGSGAPGHTPTAHGAQGHTWAQQGHENGHGLVHPSGATTPVPPTNGHMPIPPAEGRDRHRPHDARRRPGLEPVAHPHSTPVNGQGRGTGHDSHTGQMGHAPVNRRALNPGPTIRLPFSQIVLPAVFAVLLLAAAGVAAARRRTGRTPGSPVATGGSAGAGGSGRLVQAAQAQLSGYEGLRIACALAAIEAAGEFLGFGPPRVRTVVEHAETIEVTLAGQDSQDRVDALTEAVGRMAGAAVSATTGVDNEGAPRLTLSWRQGPVDAGQTPPLHPAPLVLPVGQEGDGRAVHLNLAAAGATLVAGGAHGSAGLLNLLLACLALQADPAQVRLLVATDNGALQTELPRLGAFLAAPVAEADDIGAVAGVIEHADDVSLQRFNPDRDGTDDVPYLVVVDGIERLATRPDICHKLQALCLHGRTQKVYILATTQNIAALKAADLLGIFATRLSYRLTSEESRTFFGDETAAGLAGGLSLLLRGVGQERVLTAFELDEDGLHEAVRERADTLVQQASVPVLDDDEEDGEIEPAPMRTARAADMTPVLPPGTPPSGRATPEPEPATADAHGGAASISADSGAPPIAPAEIPEVPVAPSAVDEEAAVPGSPAVRDARLTEEVPGQAGAPEVTEVTPPGPEDGPTVSGGVPAEVGPILDDGVPAEVAPTEELPPPPASRTTSDPPSGGAGGSDDGDSAARDAHAACGHPPPGGILLSSTPVGGRASRTDDAENGPEKPITVRLFGTVSVDVRGEPLTSLQQRARRCLAIVAALGPDPVPFDELFTQLWPCEAIERGKLDRLASYIRVTLRSAAQLGKDEGGRDIDPFKKEPAGYWLNPDVVAVDVHCFDRLYRRLQELRDTLGEEDLEQRPAYPQMLAALERMYTGDLWLGDAPAWALGLREDRRRQYVEVLFALAAWHADVAGNLAQALRVARKLDDLQQTDEEAARLVIELLGRSGDAARLARYYDEFSARLAAMFNGQEPSPPTRSLYARWKRQLEDRTAREMREVHVAR